jgi:hypothetical protein
MQLNGWDHALKVTADGRGFLGHAGAILLRKAAGQAGLTAGLSAALRTKGSAPLLDRGTVLVSLAVAIALGATSMSDIALLAHLSPVLGSAPGGPTVRRALDLAGTRRMPDRIARARAKARGHAWDLIEKTPAGFPWLAVAGKTLTGSCQSSVDTRPWNANRSLPGVRLPARRRPDRSAHAASPPSPPIAAIPCLPSGPAAPIPSISENSGSCPMNGRIACVMPLFIPAVMPG